MRERLPGNRTTPHGLGERIDAAIFAIAPGWGQRRLAARVKQQLVLSQLERMELDRNYDRLGHPSMHPNVARDSRFISSRQSTDEQLAESLVAMQYRSREVVTTNPHAAGAVEGRVAHEIGVGLACRPEIQVGDGIDETTARLANTTLKEVCRSWSEHGVDRQRQFSLAAIQRMTQRTYATYGEIFVLLREAPYQGPIGLTVELVNPLHCETPPELRTDEHVKLDIRYHPTTSQILGYYFRIAERRRGLLPQYEYIERYDATGQQRVCHVFEPLHPDQSRGLPWLMAAIPFLKDTDDFHEAELINKQVEACLGVVITGGKTSPTPQQLAEGHAVDRDDDGRIEELYPGMVHYQSEDGEVKVIDPSRPGGNFAPFIEHSLRGAAAAGNMPYEVLAKNFFRTTYSSGRLAMLDGKLGFDMRRQPTIDMLLRPLHRRLVADAFFHGHMEAITSRVSYLADRRHWERHSWGGSSFGSVDPEKEIKAHALGLDSGQENLAMIAAEQNRDWQDVMVQRDAELRKEIELRVAREALENELRTAAGLPPLGSSADGSDDARKPDQRPGESAEAKA